MNVKIQEQITADLSAAGSTGLAAATWIADLNSVLQLGATGVAIVAGVGAAWWHIEKALAARKERLNVVSEGSEKE
jgi:hypothetical protein